MVIESNNASIIASDMSIEQDVYPQGTLMLYKNGIWLPLLGGDMVVRIWDDPLPPPVKNIDIDIKPGSDLNPINLKNNGSIPVGILSSADFDAVGVVDQTSLSFGRTGGEISFRLCEEPRDINEDGLLDLVCVFETQKTGFQTGDIQGLFKGKTQLGENLEGKDKISLK